MWLGSPVNEFNRVKGTIVNFESTFKQTIDFEIHFKDTHTLL